MEEFWLSDEVTVLFGSQSSSGTGKRCSGGESVVDRDGYDLQLTSQQTHGAVVLVNSKVHVHRLFGKLRLNLN